MLSDPILDGNLVQHIFLISLRNDLKLWFAYFYLSHIRIIDKIITFSSKFLKSRYF